MPYSGQTIKPLIDVPSDGNACWEWKGCVNKKTGYGKKTVNGKDVLAHRWAYETFFGPIPLGMVINHKCSNTACVNPSHLEAVTQSENCWHGDGSKLSRIQAKTIKRLHPYKVWGLASRLAQRYGVSSSLIHDIWNGRAWKEI